MLCYIILYYIILYYSLHCPVGLAILRYRRYHYADARFHHICLHLQR